VEENSEEAFRTLVERHINLVYGTARRLVSNPHEAEEITQTVFILLARKAGTLSPRILLAGWLYRTTGYVAAQLLRSESRRHQRLQNLSAMNPTPIPTEPEALWERIQPLLEDAMDGLGQADREAVILRFLEGKSLLEVGRSLGLSEDAARKRVQRALEKLRTIFSRRKIVTTSSLLSAALTTSVVAAAAPAGLATAVTTAAIAQLSSGVLLATSTSTLLKGTLAIMTWTKTKVAVVAIAVLLLGGGTAVLIHQRDRQSRPVAPGAEAAAPSQAEIIVANDEGRLGGAGNRLPDWRNTMAQAQSLQQREQIQKIWCVDNLKQVGGAAHEWALMHGDQFPGDFFSLRAIIGPRYLTCPTDSTRTESIQWSGTTTANVSYVLVSPDAKDTRPNRVIVRCPVHGHVALSDGSVLQGNIVAQRRLGPDNVLQ
jgi:RNA polymerase sigma factor (sigma-70 family)